MQVFNYVDDVLLPKVARLDAVIAETGACIIDLHSEVVFLFYPACRSTARALVAG
jgi:hypothetical protein